MKVTYSREKINPFGGLNFINSTLKRNGTFDFIDNQLGNRSDLAEYTNSDIIKAMWYTVYSGGDCAEDIEDHLKAYLSSLNSMKVPSADTLLRVQKKLATVKETILSDTGIEHDYNINEKLNRCNIRLLVHLGMLCSEDEDIVFDYDNQFIPTGKYDSKHSYKHKDGYFPGIAMINDMPVYIENRNGNSNVKFNQAPTLERAYSLLLDEGIKVKLSRMDCGSFAKDIIGTVEKYSEYFYIRAQRCEDLYGKIKGIGYWETVEIGFKQYEIASIEYAPFGVSKTYRYVISRDKNTDGQLNWETGDDFTYRAILTNDRKKTGKEVIEFYNDRGGSEKVFDVMNNDFNWKKMPFSFLNQNTVYLIIMAMCKNVYQYLLKVYSLRVDFVKPWFRLKKFIFRFITIPVKWIRRGRQKILKIFSEKPYHLVLDC